MYCTIDLFPDEGLIIVESNLSQAWPQPLCSFLSLFLHINSHQPFSRVVPLYQHLPEMLQSQVYK